MSVTKLNGHTTDIPSDVTGDFIATSCVGANILNRDVQQHIGAGCIDALPTEIVLWFRDFIKLSGQMHARDHNINESHACRSLLAKAEAELRRRELLSAIPAANESTIITTH